MADVLTKLAYETFQQGKSVFGLAHKALNAQLFRLVYPNQPQAAQPLKPELLFQIQQRLRQLMETDWQDAERGVYPASLLFDSPWSDFFRYYPLIWLEMPNIWERSQQKRHQEFDSGTKNSTPISIQSATPATTSKISTIRPMAI